jgi:WD40 repeat protein
MEGKLVVIFNAAIGHFYFLQSKENVWCVDWISRNRLACSYDDGTVEIHEIELGFISTSNLVKKLVVSTHFTSKNQVFPFPKNRGMKSDVWSIAWNEQLQLLATSSHDGWVKVFPDTLITLVMKFVKF